RKVVMKRSQRFRRAARRVAGPGTAVVLLAAGLSAFGAGTAQADVSTSAWYNLVANNSGKCVDAAAAATANGTAVQQYTCNGTTAQEWQVTATDSGCYRGGVSTATSQRGDVPG